MNSQPSSSGLHASSILQLLGTIGLVGALTRAVYILWLHPLSRFPGPRSWALTRIPYFRVLTSGDTAPAFHALHQKYGPVVRVGPNELSYIDPRAWQDIYGFHSQGELFRLNHLWYRPQPNGAPGILSSPEPDHTRVRRSIAPAFSEKALRDQEELIQGYVDTMMIQLRKESTKGPVNMVDWYNYITFDIIGDLAFADSYNSLTSSKYRQFITEAVDSFKQLIWLAASGYFPGFQLMVYLFSARDIVRRQGNHFRNTQAKVQSRIKLSDERRTDFMMYLRRNPEKNDMSEAEIESTFALLVAAGTETTATTLASCMYMLLENPSAQKRLAAEIRTAFQDEHQITADATSKMLVLNAVIDETLRLFPPVPTVLPRIVPPGGAAVCGEWLAGGTEVSTVNFAMTHSERHFSHPDEFIPERWLPAGVEGAKPQAVHDTMAFRPFSYGSRSCIGMNLAYLEMRIILAKLVWNFDLAGKPPRKWTDQKVYIFWEKQPLMVDLVPVQR